MIYKTIDLCAGIGGIRKGFELTGGFENVLSAEIDDYACMTYKHLYGDDAKNDITCESFKSLVEMTDYDVLLAGFPCQTFSNVGKQAGFEDQTKGTIFFHIAEIIKRTRPKVVFLENVENIVRHDKGRTFRVIIETLEDSLNYRVVGVRRNLIGEVDYDERDFIRNSKDFGVPQNRPRTYIIAFDRDYYRNCHELEDAVLPNGRNLRIYCDLDDIIELGAPSKFYLSEGYWQTLIRHRVRQTKNGNNFGYRIVYSPDNRHQIANTILATGGSGKERNLVIDIQEDIPGQLVGLKKSPLNSDCVRFMTPREWGKLQGFVNYAFVDAGGVDRFSFPPNISISQQYKQLGNAVSIPVIQSMADFILHYI